MLFKVLLGVAGVAVLSACGGGGDEEPAPAYLAGTYSVSYAKTRDNCLIGGVYNGSQHVVTINGAEITVQINTITLKGRARDDGGLSAVYENRTEASTARATVTYAMPAGQTAPGNGTFNSELLAQGIDNRTGFTCDIRYNGTVTKVG